MVRRFGPTRGAGTAVIEKSPQPSINPAALGICALTGIMRKGPVGKVFRAGTSTDYRFRAGGYIPESQLPDAAFDFYDSSKGAGAVYLNRVVDGNEKLANLLGLNRRAIRSSSLKVKAGNPGSWAGRKQLVVDEYDSITANTLTLTNPPADLKVDELVGAQVVLSAVAGKSYKVLSNDENGVLTFAVDVDLVTDVGSSTNKLTAVTLTNGGEAIGVLFKEGTTNPTTEFAIEVYMVEGGIPERVKTYDNLSVDPDDSNYYVKVVNDDSDADYLIRVEDLHVGTYGPDVRPANYFSVSESLTATVLKAQITDAQANSNQGAKGEAKALTLGGSVIKDKLTLTVTQAGVRASGTLTFGSNPADGETITVNGKVITFKSTVADDTSEVAIGADAEATLENTLAFINASKSTELKDKIFTEKNSASELGVFANTAGVEGNTYTLASSTAAVTVSGANLTSGTAEEWSVVSEEMPFVTYPALTSGVAYVAPNEYGFGFTFVDQTEDSTKSFEVGDTVDILVYPLPVNGLVGGNLVPKASKHRKKFPITSNTADEITVKTGSDMTSDADEGDEFRVEYIQQLAGGYDGIAGITDIDYENAYDTTTSPLRGLRGNNLGLVKLATPGITSTTVQKAGAQFAESQAYEYRYEVPANVSSEDAAEEYINETIGRNDFAVVTFPTYAYVTNPTGQGMKLSTRVGEIFGEEASVAADFQGYHKAAAGVDVQLSKIRALPEALQDKELDQELLNPQGIGMIVKKSGNFVLWSDRTVSVNPGWKWKHQREQMSHYENTFLENFDFIIFAINNRQTQTQLISAFIAYFTPELAKGAVEGDSVQDAIQLKIDEENNTAVSRAAGDLNAGLALNFPDTVERFKITMSKQGITEDV